MTVPTPPPGSAASAPSRFTGWQMASLAGGSVGGALTVTALALVELIRLRRRGFRLPAGPWQ